MTVEIMPYTSGLVLDFFLESKKRSSLAARTLFLVKSETI